RKLELVVVDAPEAKEQEVLHVVLVEAPRDPRALSWDAGERALYVARLEVDEWHGLHRRVANARRHDVIAPIAHAIEQPTDVLGDEVTFERPRRIRIPDGRREVRDVAVHHA